MYLLFCKQIDYKLTELGDNEVIVSTGVNKCATFGQNM